MGIIRGGLVTIVTILLFVSLVFAGACLTFSLSLDYNVLKPEMHNTVSDILLKESDLNKSIDASLMNMKVACNVNDSIFLEMDNDFVEIPCDVVDQGSEAVISSMIDSQVEKNYYKEYNCTFWDCFNEQNPFFIFSEHSQDYWNSKFYFGLIASMILGAALFFFIEKRSNYPFLLGVLFIIISFLFLLAGKLVPIILGWDYASIIGILFTQAYLVFLIFIIIGVILIFLGIVLKFLYLGRFIAKLFHRDVTQEDVKKEVREEMQKEKSKSKKSKK